MPASWSAEGHGVARRVWLASQTVTSIHAIDPATDLPIGLRRAPKQARSRARVDAAITALVEMIGEDPGRAITAADVAARIDIPVGSLYEYFEDVPAIVDAAVARMLDRHDEVLRDLQVSPASTVHEFIDTLFDSYLLLYAEQPAFIVLRNSSYWNEQHRQWLSARVETFLADLTSTMWRELSLGGSADLDRRFSLIFSAADAMLQRILRESLKPDELLADDARATVKFMFDHVARSSA